MNKCYIISYQLIPNRNIEPLHNAIKAYGTWAKINETTWAIVTTISAIEIRNYLQRFLNTNDRLFIIKSGLEAAWSNAACTNEWLKNNL